MDAMGLGSVAWSRLSTTDLQACEKDEVHLPEGRYGTLRAYSMNTYITITERNNGTKSMVSNRNIYWQCKS